MNKEHFIGPLLYWCWWFDWKQTRSVKFFLYYSANWPWVCCVLIWFIISIRTQSRTLNETIRASSCVATPCSLVHPLVHVFNLHAERKQRQESLHAAFVSSTPSCCSSFLFEVFVIPRKSAISARSTFLLVIIRQSILYRKVWLSLRHSVPLIRNNMTTIITHH